MKIAYQCSINDALPLLQDRYKDELDAVMAVVQSIQLSDFKTGTCQAATRSAYGQATYDPRSINRVFKDKLQWNAYLAQITQFDLGFSYEGKREIDFLKNKVGLEIQLGKYTYPFYDMVCKMNLLHKMGLLEVGIEIIPTRSMSRLLWHGVGFFEQVISELYMFGFEEIKLPILVIGVEDDIPVTILHNQTDGIKIAS